MKIFKKLSLPLEYDEEMGYIVDSTGENVIDITLWERHDVTLEEINEFAIKICELINKENELQNNR